MAKITRVCLIGPESTGKSQLAARLAEHFNAPVVAEYAREYAEARGNRLSYDHVEAIARGHIQSTAERGSGTEDGLIVLDTDLISTVVYSRHYYGRVPDWVVEEARTRAADLYLLMDTDVPWVADAARDTGGDEREDLFDRFRAALDEFEVRWTVISGEWEERFNRAVEAIADLK